MDSQTELVIQYQQVYKDTRIGWNGGEDTKSYFQYMLRKVLLVKTTMSGRQNLQYTINATYISMPHGMDLQIEHVIYNQSSL